MTLPEPLKNFPLPWNAGSHYWLCLMPTAALPTQAKAALREAGFTPFIPIKNAWLAKAPRQWNVLFAEGCKALGPATENARAGVVIDGAQAPDANTISYQLKPLPAVAKIAESLWLGEAMLEGRIRSYMQPVVDRRGKVFGHEAFARALSISNEVIGGGKIIAASRDLNIEHLLDRYLQVHAIRTFIESDLQGFLFINFTPGFIHRPEVYLEGLTDTVTRTALPPKHIVLDFTQAETPRDAAHLKGIFDYCHSKGYSTSLDDVASVEVAERLIAKAPPDFIKLDITLTRKAGEAEADTTIAALVRAAHAAGCTVIAEGVETEKVYHALQKAGIDLFQGYLFSAAVAPPLSTATANAQTQH